MSQFSPSPDPILVVGGGPTGLTTAIELLRRGVPCRVIDRREGPVMTSRSFTLHARTLELFEKAGDIRQFLKLGIPSVSMDYHFQDVEEVARLDFTQLDSRYPYVLVIEQSITEKVLREQLASLAEAAGSASDASIEWNTELRSVTVDDDGAITATLVHTDDGHREEIVRPRWLVGCDGLRSIVRTQLGLDFQGDEYTGMEMKMMDVPLDGFSLSDDIIHYFIDKNHMLLITKLPGGAYRVLISDMGGAGQTVSMTEPEGARAAFQSIVDAHFHGNVALREPEWTTVFTIWRRISTGYRRGNIFLVGDAAHIHSPAGGQGMNACIQDAVNLGWKLAAVASGHAHEALLDTYERERRPIAQQVIEGTDLLHRVIMAHGKSIEDRLAITREPGFNLRAVQQISGESYTYRGAVAEPQGSTPLDGLAAGDRAPDVTITPQLRLHDLLGNPYYTLLVLQRDPLSTLPDWVTQAARPYGAGLEVVVIASAEVGSLAPTGAVVAESNDVFDRYGDAAADSLCLVRPDGYIGARCRSVDKTALFTMLESVLTAGEPIPDPVE